MSRAVFAKVVSIKNRKELYRLPVMKGI